MREILHISDVHFGPFHLADRTRGLLDLVEERSPHLVAISGDLTQRAKPRQFEEARRFLARLPVPALAVPGNHDVPLYRVWERALDPFGAYRRFSADLEPVFRDEELLVVGVNTAFNWTFTGGRVGPRQLASARRLFAEAPAELFRVAVAHHHLIRPPSFRGQRGVRRADRVLAGLAGAGVDLVLSGHVHQSHLEAREAAPGGRRGPLLVVHAGTATSSRGRGAERSRNTCNWIRVDDLSVSVVRLEWDRGAGRFAERGGSSHLRSGPPVSPESP